MAGVRLSEVKVVRSVSERRLTHARRTHLDGALAVGEGFGPAHHGELLQGMFTDDSGRLRRALVTLPHPHRGSRAIFRPSQSHWGIVGTP
jgi:hypothetical protein